MTGLNSLGWQIHDHLKEFRPKMFQALKAQGKLKQTVEAMQNQASATMASLEAQGLYHHEAWEIVKDDVLLPSEEDVPNLGENIQPYTD
jgi:tRNA A58 N-methylase Trm61